MLPEKMETACKSKELRELRRTSKLLVESPRNARWAESVQSSFANRTQDPQRLLKTQADRMALLLLCLQREINKPQRENFRRDKAA